MEGKATWGGGGGVEVKRREIIGSVGGIMGEEDTLDNDVLGSSHWRTTNVLVR